MLEVMESKRLIKKKIMLNFIVMISLLLLAVCLVSDSTFAETATGTKVTYKGSITSMGSTCGKFTVKGYDAFCADHSAPTPPTGTKITGTKVVTKTEMRKALYYGYGGPKAKVSKNNAGWVSTSIALSRANGNGGGSSEAQKFYKSLKNYDTPPDSFTVYYCTTSGNKQDLCYWIYKPEGKVRINKQSTDANATSSRGYKLEGAVYGVYTDKECSSSKRIAKLITTSSGLSSKVTLDKGTYYIKEITAPNGFSLSSGVYTVTVTDQCDKTVTVKDAPIEGKIQLVKSSSEPEKTNGNAGYSLAGAQYGIWSDKGLSKSVGTFTTKADGKSNVVSLLAGTYYIKETKAPKGYLTDTKTYEVKIAIEDLKSTKEVNVKDVPEDDPAWVLLQKIDGETGEPVPQGGGSFEGAEFTVKYYEGTDWKDDPSKSGAEDKGTWIFKTNKNGYVSFDDESLMVTGDELYYNDLGNPTFPIGTITIQESKAPKGYVKNDETFVVKILKDDNEPGVSLSQIPTTEILQQPIRGDIEIIKTDKNTGKRLKGVTFEIVNKMHKQVVATITTDENGYATTASEEHPNGTLLYGNYIIREKETPTGYLPMEDIEVFIDENREKVYLKIENVPADIKTTARFKETGTNEIITQDFVTIVDEVRYENLIPGETYRLEGVLMDKSTEKPILMGEQEVAVETEFTAEKSSGIISMEFPIDGRTVSGKAITVFEYLYIDETLIADHTDINDINQTVRFLEVGNIEIYKGDSTTGEPLEGVKFEIINKKTGKALAELITDENGYASTADLEDIILVYGDYIVRETEPLPGYMDIGDIEVTLDDFNKTMSLKIDNAPIVESSADTSDKMGRAIPLTLALFCIAIFGVIVVTRKRC